MLELTINTGNKWNLLKTYIKHQFKKEMSPIRMDKIIIQIAYHLDIFEYRQLINVIAYLKLCQAQMQQHLNFYNNVHYMTIASA